MDRKGSFQVSLLALASSVIAGCSSHAIPTEDQALESSTTVSIRQVDDQGLKLPFETTFSARWNDANDGTKYEPCTAVGARQLAALGVDPASVEDAAGSNGQTLRGCDWDYLRVDGGSVRWSVSQFVGNSPSLEHDKRVKSAVTDVWLPDV
ncbi:DUF3558 family protein, partial [Gordonia hydrophobica]